MNASVKRVIFLALLLLAKQNTSAVEIYHNCFETLEEQQAEIADMRNECLSFGGGGATFDVYAPSVPVTCKITSESGVMIFENYYGALYDCNTCNSEKMLKDLEMYEGICNGECRQNAVKCIHIQHQWGSDLQAVGTAFGNHICGDKDPSLPGCSESSSSEFEQSSSSEEQSSSSEGFSSSEEESSSSENDENSSSSEEDVDSSSSENDGCDEEIEDCDIDRTGEICYSGHPNDCSSMEYTTFANRPAMIGDFYFYDYIMCRDGQIEFHANVPEVNFSPTSFMCKKEGCQGYHKFEGDWHCIHQDPPVDGCISDFYEIAPMGFHYNLQERQLYSFWGKVDFEHDSLITESKFDVAYFDVEELYNAIVQRSVYVYDDTGAKVSLGLLYTDIPLKTFDDYVYACAYHFGLVEKSSSSQAIASSSSSNDSLDIDWDYYFSCSSVNSVTTSSSEEINSSSSKEYDESSSSSEYVTSSNSAVALNIGPNQDYSPDQIFNEGLQNMEEGKCYSLNPDRGAQHGWINDNAQDTWWWREVDCETGDKVDKNKVGMCPGFPLDAVPINPDQACIAYQGKCYRCKSENSYVDCSLEWLWKWNFNEQNIGYWYEEIDCNMPQPIRRMVLTIALACGK